MAGLKDFLVWQWAVWLNILSLRSLIWGKPRWLMIKVLLLNRWVISHHRNYIIIDRTLWRTDFHLHSGTYSTPNSTLTLLWTWLLKQMVAATILGGLKTLVLWIWEYPYVTRSQGNNNVESSLSEGKNGPGFTEWPRGKNTPMVFRQIWLHFLLLLPTYDWWNVKLIKDTQCTISLIWNADIVLFVFQVIVWARVT